MIVLFVLIKKKKKNIQSSERIFTHATQSHENDTRSFSVIVQNVKADEDTLLSHT